MQQLFKKYNISQHIGPLYSKSLLLLVVLKNLGNARTRESDLHPIRPKTPAFPRPHNRNLWKERRGMENRGRQKKGAGSALETRQPIPTITVQVRSFHRDTDRGRIKVLPYFSSEEAHNISNVQFKTGTTDYTIKGSAHLQPGTTL